MRNMGVLYQFQLRALDQCRMSPALSQERPSHYRQLLIDCLHLLSPSALWLHRTRRRAPGQLDGPHGRVALGPSWCSHGGHHPAQAPAAASRTPETGAPTPWASSRFCITPFFPEVDPVP